MTPTIRLGRLGSDGQKGDLFFTAPPSLNPLLLPQPFRVAARQVLSLSTLFPDVLVLGYGLGAMAGEISRVREHCRIVGIEPDPAMAKQAQRFLPRQAVLLVDDALSYLRQTRRTFDFILDDCFELTEGEPMRPVELRNHAEWVARRLRPSGIYVRNLLPQEDATVPEQCLDIERALGPPRLRRFRDWDNVLATAVAPSRGGSFSPKPHSEKPT